MAEAVLDGESYFTNGACVPSGETEAVAWFTNGLLFLQGLGTPGAGMDDGFDDRTRRRRFVKQAEEEAAVLMVLINAVSLIDADDY